MTDTYVYIPNPKVKEGSSFTATAYFRSGKSSDTPTTTHYRVDCLTTGQNLVAWTSLTPGTTVSISMTPTVNAIQYSDNVTEKKQLTVAADKGTTTETRDTSVWKVENIRGF